MIHARSIVKNYNGFTALDDVSFDLEDSGIFGIVGHNGAGKTTLLKIMSGLLTPTSGELLIDGIDAVKHPDALKSRLGYLPEESRLYENMTVGGYLSFFGEIYRMSPEEIRKRSRDILHKLDLDAGDKKLGELSKGMKRKVAIARSLIHDPSFLVYDEPTSGLDPMTSRYISQFLRSIKKEGEKTILLSAHNLYQVEELCDKVLILQRGKRLMFGSMDELREKFGSVTYEIEFVVSDRSVLRGVLDNYEESGGVISAKVEDVDSLNDLTAIIASEGGRVKRIESHYPSLEEMLMQIGR
ncbi:ABC transporter ATP-binding protein [Methanoplanus sp. FWC-SCC4]|uniref:ABC transporter ATP-binding protein n=1 Tax=Methanochimaera problematica TaxID=2609417 RepID=A0AA97FAS7_9EURY|nr:ABC transporter ATP-binding protein [Methanoplanus sp. FWC-SCC4]WOF15549.1 ABC transporter ATP-binding protein [Methanoplanus sp. FWC-SCC4]